MSEPPKIIIDPYFETDLGKGSISLNYLDHEVNIQNEIVKQHLSVCDEFLASMALSTKYRWYFKNLKSSEGSTKNSKLLAVKKSCSSRLSDNFEYLGLEKYDKIRKQGILEMQLRFIDLIRKRGTCHSEVPFLFKTKFQFVKVCCEFHDLIK